MKLSLFGISAALFGTYIAPLAGATYVLETSYTPENFFSQFYFDTQSDPTHGWVNYVDGTTAENKGLVKTGNNSVYIGVDHTNAAPSGRDSVRLTSNTMYTHGLYILDLTHMPGGICGVWPAFWTVGADWPSEGEIDIIEGVNSATQNSMTLHTADKCSIGDTGLTGRVDTNNCFIYAPNQYQNAGCGISDRRTQSFGTGFNQNGGGVYAMEWTSKAINVWFFPRNSIPANAMGSNPDPTHWGSPSATFRGGCEIDSHFTNHQIVFNTDFCGDWAGNTWTTDTKCASLAPTCNDYVANNPKAFSEAYWEINSLRVFSS